MGYDQKTTYIKGRVNKWNPQLWKDLRIEAAHKGTTITNLLIEILTSGVNDLRKLREKK